jgi:biotin synthase-related radical SAM superfamily protein
VYLLLTCIMITGMSDAMSAMPKIQSELSRIETSLQAIDNEMKSLTVQLKAFDEKNIAGVEDLSRLDTLKSNMEKCRAMLEEHTRWSQLVREAHALLEGRGRLTESADRLVHANNEYYIVTYLLSARIR